MIPVPPFRGRYLGEGYVKKVIIEMTDEDVERTLQRVEYLMEKLEALADQIETIKTKLEKEKKDD